MKKKFYFTFLLVCAVISNFSAQNVAESSVAVQKPKTSASVKMSSNDLYGRWSLDIHAGTNKPVTPFAVGYYASAPNQFSNFGTINHLGLGVRYMASNLFGFKSVVNFDKISNSSKSNSNKFDLSLYTFTLEGVLNLGRIARFETFTSKFNLLAHFGVQTTYKTVDFRAGITDIPNSSGSSEQDGGIVFGFTPEYKINKNIALFADFSYYTNFRQNINWDGSRNLDSNLNGYIYTTSIGVSFSLLSKGKEHADWYVAPIVDNNAQMIKRLEAVETLVADVDRDGVPDFRDLQNNSPTGVTVDSKGRFIDLNKNGIADEAEKTSASNVAVPSQATPSSSSVNNVTVNNVQNDVVRELIDKGYFNIFFDSNRDYPNSGSADNMYQIIQYLKLNSTSKVKLIGYTDKSGDVSANKNLSERRARSVFNLITASGIDATRIKIAGFGIDDNIPYEAKAGNNMARRVAVVLEK